MSHVVDRMYVLNVSEDESKKIIFLRMNVLLCWTSVICTFLELCFKSKQKCCKIDCFLPAFFKPKMILSGKQSSQTGNDGGTDTPRPKFTSLTSLPGNDGFKFEAPKAIHVNILSDTNEGSIVGFVVFRDTPDDSLTLADLREAIKSQFDSDQLEALGGGDRFKFLQNAIPISKKQEKDIQISECHDIQGVKHKMSLGQLGFILYLPIYPNTVYPNISNISIYIFLSIFIQCTLSCSSVAGLLLSRIYHTFFLSVNCKLLTAFVLMD